jgi:predicted RNase H-like HicB family nuclease
MSVQHFTARIHHEDNAYWAEVIELPGCFASGDTLDELREALEEAISLYLDDDPNAGTITDVEVPRRPMEVGEMKVCV